MTTRRFTEQAWRMLASLVVIGFGAWMIYWDMFLEVTDSPRIRRDLTPDNPVGYVLLVLLALSALAMCWRLTVAREAVVLEGDRIRFGRRGRTVLHRDEIARVSVERGRLVTLHLRPPDATHVCDRSHFHRPKVLLLAGDFRDGAQLPGAIEAWFEAPPQP